MFQTNKAQKITQRIAALKRQAEERERIRPCWLEIKRKFYPDYLDPINLGEMDFRTLYPWGKPKDQRPFEFSEKTSERYTRAGTNRFGREGKVWSDTGRSE